MICHKCGHLTRHHTVEPYFLYKGCIECADHKANRSQFWEHLPEDNLEYLERLVTKKDLSTNL